MLFEEKITIDKDVFLQKVDTISKKLGISPDWLMAVMAFETGGSFMPNARNPVSKATGLIQFMPATAIGLKTTIDNLARMTAVNQLDYVYAYLLPYSGKLKSFVDTYLAVFFPAAIGKTDDYVLESIKISAKTLANQNPAFDVNKDAKVTVGELREALLKKLPASLQKSMQPKGNTLLLLGLGALALMAFRK